LPGPSFFPLPLLRAPACRGALMTTAIGYHKPVGVSSKNCGGQKVEDPPSHARTGHENAIEPRMLS
jgi:hypothetical protein